MATALPKWNLWAGLDAGNICDGGAEKNAKRNLRLIALWIVCVLPCAGQEKLCTISDENMKKATATFAKIANIFRNPRCLNCHGGVNPFTADTKHVGGTYEVVRDKEGDTNFDKTFKPCQGCHSAFPDWMVPDENQSFVNKDDVAFCKLMKSDLMNGPDVIDHFAHDRGNAQFIEVVGLPVPTSYCGGSARRIKAANRASERMGSYTGETLIQES